MLDLPSRMIVVGEKFYEFADRQENTITIGRLVEILWDDEESLPDEIVIGQGIEYGRLVSALDTRRHLDSRPLPRIVNHELIADQHNSLHRSSVHKKKCENVLITAPRRVDPATFVMQLSIQDSCELLTDHMTGQHIQGIVLFEAARQAMLSICETFLLPPELRGRCYFVLNEITTDYKRFAFPVTTTIEVGLSTQEAKGKGGLKGVVACRFLQCGAEITVIRIAFAAYEAEFIHRREDDLARDASLATLATAEHAAFTSDPAHLPAALLGGVAGAASPP